MCAAWYTVDCVNSTDVWTFAYWLQPGYHPYYPHFFFKSAIPEFRLVYSELGSPQANNATVRQRIKASVAR